MLVCSHVDFWLSPSFWLFPKLNSAFSHLECIYSRVMEVGIVFPVEVIRIGNFYVGRYDRAILNFISVHFEPNVGVVAKPVSLRPIFDVKTESRSRCIFCDTSECFSG